MIRPDRPTLTLAVLAMCALLSGCAGPVPPPREPWEAVATVPPERRLCGWEELGPKEAPLAIVDSSTTHAMPGDAVLTIAPTATTPYGTVRTALQPAETSLIRLKLVVDGRWLLPTTYPQKHRQPKKPPPEHRATRVVGRRQITRDTRRPAERFAALRVRGDRVLVFVENERQAGDDHAISELESVFAGIEPKPEVFALTASAETPWKNVLATAIAAACYDRRAGDEPHEVILD